MREALTDLVIEKCCVSLLAVILLLESGKSNIGIEVDRILAMHHRI